MNKIIKFITSVIFVISVLLLVSCGEETTTEKVEIKSNELQRVATEKMNRIEESVCTESEAECLAKKAKNRTQEAADIISDKATELKNKMDN